MKYTLIRPLAGLLLALLGVTACKKTMDAPALPNSRIIAYKVPVSDGLISGVIDEADKTITVYIPFYYQLDVIDPQVKVSEGAKLSEEVTPVDVMNERVTYTVTGADKSTSTYKLKIELQQLGPLVLVEPSTPTVTAGWAIGGSTINLQGNFNTTDPNKVKVFLVGTDQAEHPLTVSEARSTVTPVILSGVKTYTLSNLYVPQTLAEGDYKVRVKMQRLAAETANPIRLVYGRPEIDYKLITAKQGETFTISSSGVVLHDFTELSIQVAGVKTLLPIESYTRTQAIIRIPESIPVGTYAPTVLFAGWPSSTLNWTITVNAK